MNFKNIVALLKLHLNNISDPPNIPSFSVNDVDALETIKIIEGRNKTLKCLTSSEPAPYSYTWTYPGGTSIGENMTITNVERRRSGTHTCEVENFMDETVGQSIIGKNSNSILLDVLRK